MLAPQVPSNNTCQKIHGKITSAWSARGRCAARARSAPQPYSGRNTLMRWTGACLTPKSYACGLNWRTLIQTLCILAARTGPAGHGCCFQEIDKYMNHLTFFFGGVVAFCSAPCSLFFGCDLGWWLYRPQFLCFFFGSHRISRMLSIQAAVILLMAMLCACGPAAVRGQLTFAQACGSSSIQAVCSSRSPPLTAVPTGIPTTTTSL
jgi:hypothetical protein